LKGISEDYVIVFNYQIQLQPLLRLT